MLRWIYLEIKQMMSNKKNIIIFIALILMHIIALSSFGNDADIMTNKIKEYTRMAEMQELNPFSLEMYSPEETELNNKILKAISENDIEEFNKLILIKNLIEVNKVERYLLNIENTEKGQLQEKIDSYYLNYNLHQQLKDKIYQNFGYIDEGEGVENYLSMYNSKVNHLQYNYDTFNKGFMFYDEPSKNSLTISLTLFRQYLMFIVVLVPLVIGFDTISKDRKDGSLRSIMALKQSRNKYIVVKTISTLIASIIIIVLPLVIALLINNVNIINDLKYPNYIYTKGVYSYEGINPIMTFDKSEYRLDNYSFHSRSAYNLNEYGYIIGVHDGVTLLTLGHILGYSLILITFIILFVISLQLAISLNTNNYLGIIITVFVLGLLLYFSKDINLISSKTQFLQHVPLLTEKLNPMRYLNVVDVVEGSLPYTFLFGITLLSVYTTIINLISSFIFKRKNITS